MSESQPEKHTHKRPDTLLADERFVRRAMSVVGLTVAVGLLLTLIILSVKVWLAVFAGILLAIFLRGLADFVTTATRLRAGWSLALVVVVLLGLAALFGWLLVPQIAEQFQQLTDQLPKAIQDVQAYFERLGWTRYVPRQAPTASEVAGNAAQVAAKAAGVFSVSVDAASILMVIAFLALYLAASPESYVNGLVALFPLTRRERVRHVLSELGATLRNWLLGQAVSMLIVGVLIAVGLKIIGVPLWLSLGLIAGICDFIPVVGPLISAIPAVLLAFTVSP